MPQYEWQTTKDPNYTKNVATRKFGTYDPNSYDYTWNGAYLDRTQNANKKPSVLETESQKAGREYLTSQLASGAKTYGGNLSAQNEYTDQIKNSLSSYLNRTAPASLGLAETELQNTLSGNYDPNTSQYYQGVRESANLNLNDALNRYSRQQYLKGSLRSTPTDVGRARLLAENSANLNQVLGTLAQQERQNRLGAVGQAQSMAGYQSGEQLNSLNALQGTSDYLTQLQQAQNDREYEEWKRAQQQQLGLGQYLYSTPATYVY